MMTSSADLLHRLVDLRRRREDRAREDLARGNAQLRRALAERDAAAELGERMQQDLPLRESLHLRAAATLARPEQCLASFVAAVGEDRAGLARQMQTVRHATATCRDIEAKVEALRAGFLAALRRREATETVDQLHRKAASTRQALREEDLAAEQARTQVEESRT